MAAVPPVAFSATVPVLVLLAADVLAELFELLLLPLDWAAAVLAALSPPPHAASARERVESASSCDFINLYVSNALADDSPCPGAKGVREVERTSGFICKPADDRGFDTGVLCAQLCGCAKVMSSRDVRPERISLQRNSCHTKPDR
ncbi:hypothetical protein B0G80_4005 [Paraburkholderia sp. BL6669N2]|uniref:hypothetical protein n=1 Tax=Paraburkholderia sp. BL6669N2 TaxID=1938807 RepID=UPI000E39A4F8|nr:hypothetical protein [Paraburkholderia sp. BL6669N2]REG61172.1 hypothetical protein B0G80_4005 [Paraburkholderia sp. BL6669N2]